MTQKLGIRERNWTCFLLKRIFKQVGDSKQTISFILTPLWNDRFSVQPTHVITSRGKFAPPTYLFYKKRLYDTPNKSKTFMVKIIPWQDGNCRTEYALCNDRTDYSYMKIMFNLDGRQAIQGLMNHAPVYRTADIRQSRPSPLRGV